MKNLLLALIAVIAVVALGAGAYYYLNSTGSTTAENTLPDITTTDDDIEEEQEVSPFQVLPPSDEETREPIETIGASVEGKPIQAYHFGTGETEILFIGGIHSAFAPNTVSVAERLIAALQSEDVTVPENVTVTVIKNLNPDASGAANTLSARLNANNVDLNRNFDCEWEATGVWRSEEVSGGDAAFSEPETTALRDYVTENNITAAVVYYAADGGVYASNCGGALDPEIADLTEIYADASGYTANDEFDAYAISGDATNWLAKTGIPSIGVLLTDYTATEWDANKAGVEAVLAAYGTVTTEEAAE